MCESCRGGRKSLSNPQLLGLYIAMTLLLTALAKWAC